MRRSVVVAIVSFVVLAGIGLALSQRHAEPVLVAAQQPLDILPGATGDLIPAAQRTDDSLVGGFDLEASETEISQALGAYGTTSEADQSAVSPAEEIAQLNSPGDQAQIEDPPATALPEHPTFARPELFSAPSFRMPVPFRTQKDGGPFQGSNCGPAALGMVLEAYGLVESNGDLRFLTHTYQGTVGRRGGTALQHMATVGADFGLEPVGLYEGSDFRRWSVDDIRAQVRAGNVVIPLVKYRLLPGHEGSTIRFDHYIVIYGMDGDRFLFHDPAYATPEEGAAHWITSAQLDTAIATTSVPRQAVAFAGGSRGQLPALVSRIQSS